MPTPGVPYLTKIGEELVVVWVNPRTGHIERKSVLMKAPTWWRSGELAVSCEEALIELRLFLEAAANGSDAQVLVVPLAELEELRSRVSNFITQS